jgi:hypothetical protein
MPFGLGRFCLLLAYILPAEAAAGGGHLLSDGYLPQPWGLVRAVLAVVRERPENFIVAGCWCLPSRSSLIKIQAEFAKIYRVYGLLAALLAT